MKAKDIVVGQDYAIGSTNYPMRFRVVEVARHVPQVWSGHRPYNGAEAIMARIVGRFHGDDWVRLTHVLKPWAQYEAEQAALQTIQQNGEERKRLREANIDRLLAERGLQLAAVHIDRFGFISILAADLENALGPTG